MLRITLWLGLILAQVVSLIFFLDPAGQWFFAILGILGGSLLPVLDILVRDIFRLRALWYSCTRCFGRTRLSISYLFRIKVDGEYLLIKSRRWAHFQPVGGVYQFYESASPALASFGYKEDTVVKRDTSSKRDLRFTVPGWRVWSAIEWFTSGLDREVGAWREFEEELIASGLLSRETFSTIDYRLIERHMTKIRNPRQSPHRELIIADIFELLPSAEQESALRELKNHPPHEILWAKPERIRASGAEPGSDLTHPIGEHAEWIIA